MDARRDRLLALLREKSYQYRSQPPLFRLASGKESPFYINCRPVTFSAEGLALVGEIIFGMIQDRGIAAVGGLTMGADPLAHATALVSFLKGRPVQSFSVRKMTKTYGTGGQVAGATAPGDRVAVLEDVVTTGGSALQAVAAARDFGLEVVQVIALVDRQEGGGESIAAVVPDFQAIFTLAELAETS